MTLVDSIIKWFKAPKTLYGIAGMIVIIIVLALDFAYWAGAIEVGTPSTNSGGGGDGDGNQSYAIEVIRVLDEEDTITAPGHGQQIPDTYLDYYFTVEENASEAIILVTLVDGISGPFRPPDLDLYVYGPNGEQIDQSATTSADEGVKLDENTLENNGPGEYKATVKSYRGIQVTYSITVDIYYKVPLETENEEGG